MEEGNHDDVRGFWNRAAAHNHYVAIYDAPEIHDLERRDAAFRSLGERDAVWLSWFTTPDMRVLDLGCGSGRVLEPLSRHVRQAVGVDISDEMLERARQAAPGARFLRTDGHSLQGIEDGSIDFAYSLLCLIHVDKKSAFRYLRELRRVLAPGALAHLQFQTLASAEGLAKFVRGLDQDMPLEFYGPEELPGFVEAAGLGLLGLQRAGEYCFVTAIHGDPERWSARYRDGLAVDELRCEGLLEAPGPMARGGRLQAAVSSRANEPLSMLAALHLRAEGVDLGVRAPVVAAPDSRNLLEVRLEAPALEPCVSWNGTEVQAAGRWSTVRSEGFRSARLDAGLLPPGQEWSPATTERFPGLLLSRVIGPA